VSFLGVPVMCLYDKNVKQAPKRGGMMLFTIAFIDIVEFCVLARRTLDNDV
jgi:hypothetical protein